MYLFLFVLSITLLATGFLMILLLPSLLLIGIAVVSIGLAVLFITKLFSKLHCHNRFLYHALTVQGFILSLLGAVVLALSPILIISLILVVAGILLLEIGLHFLID